MVRVLINKEKGHAQLLMVVLLSVGLLLGVNEKSYLQSSQYLKIMKKFKNVRYMLTLLTMHPLSYAWSAKYIRAKRHLLFVTVSKPFFQAGYLSNDPVQPRAKRTRKVCHHHKKEREKESRSIDALVSVSSLVLAFEAYFHTS
jgi:hypothetical protein